MRLARALTWLLLASLCASSRALVSSARAEVTLPPGLAAAQDEVVYVQPQLALSPRLAARAEHLQLDFLLLREGARDRRWLLGGLIAISATLVGFGAAYPRAVGALLLPVGGAGLVRGIVGLTLLPDPRVAANAYLGMPAATDTQVRERIHFGERALAAQARTDRRLRIGDGVFAFVVASSYVPLAWYVQRRHDPHYRFGDNGYGYALLSLSVINAAASLVSALSETPTEQRYRAYRVLVARQESERAHEVEASARTREHRPARLAEALTVSLFGTRQQLGGALQLRF